MENIINMAFLTILGLIALEDLKTMEISNKWHLCIILLGTLRLLICGTYVQDNLFGMVAVSLPMFVLALLCPGSIGGGDIKMVGASGFLLGCDKIVTGSGAGFLFGGIYALWLLLSGKKCAEDHFAFGPWLAIGIGGAAVGII